MREETVDPAAESLLALLKKWPTERFRRKINYWRGTSNAKNPRARVRMRDGRGGTVRSSDKVPHKGMEPRRCVKESTCRVNQKWEELTGLGPDVILPKRDDILNLMGAV